MKIFIVSDGVPSKTSALGVFANDQAVALRNAGNEVYMVAFNYYSFRDKRKYGEFDLEINGIKTKYKSFPIGVHPLGVAADIMAKIFKGFMKKAIADFGFPDIVHAHFTLPAFMAAKCKDIYKCPLVVTEHSSIVNKSKLGIQLKNISKFAYSKADALICVSQALGKNVKKNTGVDYICIHNIVQTQLFQLKKNTSESFSFVSAGNLIPLKRMDFLIRAFSKAFKTEEKVSLNIFGRGYEHNKLQQLIKELGEGNRIKLCGFVERKQLAEQYKNSDCFALVSRTETFGLSYVEAMAAGLPVIATKCGGPEDFMNDNNGILVPVNDESSLIDALRFMYNNIDSYKSEEIRNEAQDKFSPDSIATQIIDVYKTII